MKKLLLILLCVPLIGWGQGKCISGDCENGYGTFIFDDGTKYVGEFKDGKRHGQGTCTYGKGKLEGSKYIGEWKDGKKDGEGTYTFPSGNTYVGEFKDNLFHGQGTFIHTDGKIEKGLWRNDEFIGEE